THWPLTSSPFCKASLTKCIRPSDDPDSKLEMAIAPGNISLMLGAFGPFTFLTASIMMASRSAAFRSSGVSSRSLALSLSMAPSFVGIEGGTGVGVRSEQPNRTVKPASNGRRNLSLILLLHVSTCDADDGTQRRKRPRDGNSRPTAACGPRPG